MEILKWFLILVGAFLTAIVLLVILIILWVRWKFRSWAKQLEKYGALGPLVPPFRIHLSPLDEEEIDWEHADEVDEISGALAESGFQTIGAFQPEEQPVTLRALCDPKQRIYAVVYEHHEAGVWFELASFYADGRAAIFTTCEPSGLKEPPFRAVEHHPDAEPRELLEHCLATRPKEGLKPAPPEEFVDRFEHAYAREMDWRAEQGGPSEAEIRAIAGKDGAEPDPDVIETVRRTWREQINVHTSDQLREAYLDQSSLSARRWEAIRDRLFFVHDRLTIDDLLEQCEDAIYEQFENEETERLGENEDEDEDEDRFEKELERRRDEWRRRLDGKPPRKAFVEINQTLAPDLRFEKIGELKRPVAADVYLQPEWRE